MEPIGSVRRIDFWDPIASGEPLHTVEGGVAWITLNRPDAANAITPDQRDR